MAWHESEEDAESRERLDKELARRRAQGEVLESLVVPAGRKKLFRTFWAEKWCRHLESYSHYEHRLPRGRSYLRNGRVYNLAIVPGRVRAEVAGSRLYEVVVNFQPLPEEDWARLREACAGQVGSLVELLSGRLGDGAMQVLCDRDTGIFPSPSEIKMSCTCPDWADTCKHLAAVLYGIGVKFESDPGLFFSLRCVDPKEWFLAGAQDVLSGVAPKEDALSGVDLGALFGIDLTPE